MNFTATFILSVYKNDNPTHLDQAIRSMLNQVHCPEPYKIKIGVDGPVDKEISSLLKKYELNKNVEIHRFDVNNGLAFVLNRLIESSISDSTEFLLRMDADDICEPDRLRTQIDFMRNNPTIDICGGNYIQINDSNEVTKTFSQIPLNHDDCVKSFVKRNPLIHPTVIFRKDFFSKAGLYPEEFKKDQDYALWLLALERKCKFANIDKPLIKYRINDDMLKNRRSGKERAKKVLALRKRAIKSLKLDSSSTIYAYLIYIYTLSPFFIKKIAFKLLR